MSDQYLQKFAPGVYPVRTPGLRAIIDRSVAVPQSEPARGQVVWRGRYGSTLTRIDRSFQGLGDRLERIAQRLDRSAVSPATYQEPDIRRSEAERVAYSYMQPNKLSPRAAVRRSLGLK